MATVLVVDDEEPELALLAQLVKSAGHNCLVARSGREALDMLKEWCDVNAIITDLRMPEINGLRLIPLGAFGQFPGGEGILRVTTTANVRIELLAMSAEADFDEP